MRSWFEVAVVVAVGAVLGSVLGNFIGLLFPAGRIHELFSNDITAGLHPATLDLRVVDLTFGCVFHFNLVSIIGIVMAAFLYRRVFR